jgi:hypothetical protein
VTTAARKLLGEVLFDELVRQVQASAPALIAEEDPYLLASLVAVAKRIEHPELYPWPREARQVAMAIVLDAAIEADRRDREVAA